MLVMITKTESFLFIVFGCLTNSSCIFITLQIAQTEIEYWKYTQSKNKFSKKSIYRKKALTLAWSGF